MFKWFYFKRALIARIKELKAELAKYKKSPDEWSIMHWKFTKGLYEHNISILKNKLIQTQQVIQDKDQRIAELQRMLIQLQEKEIIHEILP